MATATVEEVQLLKTLRWWDGFVIALCNPGFLLGSLGFTLGIFGVIGAMILWGLSAAIGMMQAWIYFKRFAVSILGVESAAALDETRDEATHAG